MKLHATKFGVALALSSASLWTICSVLVWMFPAAMFRTVGYMVHAELAPMSAPISLFGVVVGLIGWSVASGLIGWLLATIYNKLQ